MRRYITIIIGLLVLISAQSCLRDESYYYSHYIEDYYSMDSFSINNERVTIGTDKYIRLTVQVNDYDYITDDSQYEQLSAKHKDYGGEHWVVMPDLRMCLDNDITEIKVVALDDWDGQHKKGDCLNSVCHIVAGSLYPYILNGYKKPDIVTSPSEFVSFASEGLFRWPTMPLVDKALTSLVTDDTILLNGTYTKKLFDLFIPDTKTTASCNIRIELTDDSGKKFSSTTLLE